MKQVKFINLFFILAMSLFFICPAAGAREKAHKDYELSSDPRLAMAKETYKKGQRFMEKGRRNFRPRPGQAQKHFETAEDYFSTAAFHYRELGDKYGIDTSHEISVCDGLSRKAHVWVSKSRRKRKRPGSGF